MRNRSSRTPSHSGFTLIELLVVVAVLALLIAIITPTIHKSLGSAEQTKCASNERGIYMLFQAYASDHGGNLFYANNRNPYALTFNLGTVIDTYLDQLGMTPSVFYCPAMIDQIPEMEVTDWMNPNDPRIHGIAGDEFIIGYSLVANTDRVTGKYMKAPIRDKSDLWRVSTDLLADTCAGWRPPGSAAQASGVTSWRTFPHHGIDSPVASNILRGDGSVERRPFEDLTWGYRYYHPANLYW